MHGRLTMPSCLQPYSAAMRPLHLHNIHFAYPLRFGQASGHPTRNAVTANFRESFDPPKNNVPGGQGQPWHFWRPCRTLLHGKDKLHAIILHSAIQVYGVR